MSGYKVPVIGVHSKKYCSMTGGNVPRSWAVSALLLSIGEEEAGDLLLSGMGC